VLDEGSALYPREARLVQLRTSLERSRLEQEGAAMRRRDLAEAREIEARAREGLDGGEARAALETALSIAGRHHGDSEFEEVIAFLRARVAEVAELPKSEVHSESEPVLVAEASSRSADATRVPARTRHLPWRGIVIAAACALCLLLVIVLAYTL